MIKPIEIHPFDVLWILMDPDRDQVVDVTRLPDGTIDIDGTRYLATIRALPQTEFAINKLAAYHRSIN